MKNNNLHRLVRLAGLAAAASVFALPASAEGVYRCGSSYSQEPCPGGKLVVVDDPRSQAQRTQTSEASKRDAKLGDAMEKARIKEEAKPAQALLPPPKAEEPATAREPQITTIKPLKAKGQAKAKNPEFFTATAPAKPADKTAKKSAKKKSAS
ncbi:hypothetical protein [Caenimonas aquaedulcis]|uniref:DUF4124 domain-containing protein n=1 Tax=Caenimonas aquaedulcis TaxID=2793270 RepID=A0A931H6H8_9BURK|nr:hypothetical protein [Caenimonas aquaedulcis]MBG9389556.1 hypothetical protein [Caenimonas aquaedulcis]